MRPLHLFASVLVMTIVPLVTLASPPAGPDARAFGGVKIAEIVARDVRTKTMSINFAMDHGGGGVFFVGSKTWIFRDNEETTFATLRSGQRLRVWYVPRGAKAVIIEVLPRHDNDDADAGAAPPHGD
jgi:hypothetical protein